MGANASVKMSTQELNVYTITKDTQNLQHNKTYFFCIRNTSRKKLRLRVLLKETLKTQQRLCWSLFTFDNISFDFFVVII